MAMIDNRRNLLEIVASVAQALGDDFKQNVSETEPELAKRIEYARGFTDGARMIEYKIAIRLLEIFSVKHVSQIMDMSVEQISEIANKKNATKST